MLLHEGGDLRTEDLDGAHELCVGEGGDAHLEGDAGDAAEIVMDAEELFGDGFGVADEESAGGATLGVELRPGSGGPATLFADVGEGAGVAGEEVVGGLLGGVGDVAEGVDADAELLGGVACAVAGLAVEVDEGAEAAVFASDDGDHEGETEDSGAGERGRRAADADPDG